VKRRYDVPSVFRKCTDCGDRWPVLKGVGRKPKVKLCLRCRKKRFDASKRPKDVVKIGKMSYAKLNKLSCTVCKKTWESPAKNHSGLCMYCYRMKYRADNRDQFLRTSRRYMLSSRYGLSVEEFDELFSAQKNACAICKKKIGTRLHVDHCHKTGRVRGLLCVPCNRGLGMFRDNPVRLRNASRYLERMNTSGRHNQRLVR
jgi:Recombination endonuclease VII